jgi:hypothetical protein
MIELSCYQAVHLRTSDDMRWEKQGNSKRRTGRTINIVDRLTSPEVSTKSQDKFESIYLITMYEMELS